MTRGAARNWILVFLFCLSSALAQADNDTIACGQYRRLHSETLGEDRNLLIRLPARYENSTARYAAVYVLDGEIETFLRASAAVEYLAEGEKAPEQIVVGIANTDRGRDMGAGAERFARFIRSELVPFIDGNFRTNGFRILCGQSLSTVFALYSFVKQPGAFDGYVLSSLGLSKENLGEFQKELAASAELRKIGDKYVFVGNAKTDPYDPDGARTGSGMAFLQSLKQTVPATVRFRHRIYDDEGHVPFPAICDGLKWIYSARAH